MRGAAFHWIDFPEQSNLRFNYNTVAWVKQREGVWLVELHHWRQPIVYPVASRNTGKRYIERWVDKQGSFWTSPYRKHDRQPIQKKPTVVVPGFDEPT